MHDFEGAIFTALADGLESLFDGITVVSEDLPGTELRFPVVQLRCVDSYPDERTAESGDMEVRTVQLYEAQVYSNRSRSEAKAIAKAADSLMTAWGWRRTSLTPVDGADRTIRRFAVRWRGSVDVDGLVGR